MRENADQKNSEYGHFSQSDFVLTRFLLPVSFYTPENVRNAKIF